MTNYEFGDILLLRVFPFSNLEGSKRRPGLVLVDTGDRDVMVCRITSETPRDDFDLNLLHWKENGLLLPSSVRVSKIAVLNKDLALKRIGRIGSPDRRKVKAVLKKLFSV